MKIEEKNKAIELRKTGLSIGQISKIIKASKGSISIWIRELVLTEDQKILLKNNNLITSKNTIRKLAESNKVLWKKRRELYQEEGKKLAQNKDPNFIIGCILYWAEGTKDRNSITFTNSDPNMIKLFYNFLKNTLNVSENKITLKLGYRKQEDRTLFQMEQFWLDLLSLPRSVFRKSTEEIRKSSGKRKNILKNGICTLKVNDTRLVQIIFGAIQEIGNFKNDNWIN